MPHDFSKTQGLPTFLYEMLKRKGKRRRRPRKRKLTPVEKMARRLKIREKMPRRPEASMVVKVDNDLAARLDKHISGLRSLGVKTSRSAFVMELIRRELGEL